MFPFLHLSCFYRLLLDFIVIKQNGQALRREVAGSGKSLSLELLGRNPILVFEEADLDSAVEGVVEAAFFNSGQV